MLTKLGCTFHHLGVACRNLDTEQRYWEALGYTLEGEEFQDAIQRVRGRFLVGPGPRLELLMPMGPDSPVEGVIKRRHKIYHQAFETRMFDEALATLEGSGARRTAEPTNAIAFNGRRIIFLFLPNGNLLELIEAG